MGFTGIRAKASGKIDPLSVAHWENTPLCTVRYFDKYDDGDVLTLFGPASALEDFSAWANLNGYRQQELEAEE